MKLPILSALVAVTAGACTTANSQDILTSGIYAAIAARTDGTGTTDVSATLYFGNPANLDFVDLTGNDQLVASHDGTMKVMAESTILNIVSHDASFDSGAEGDVFEVALDRTVDAGAPSSTATLPAGFALAPLPATSSRAADLVVTWSPSGSGDRMTWVTKGDCIVGVTAAVAGGDPGTLTIPANQLKLAAGATVQTCTVTVVVTREKDGDLDPHYGKGGTIVGAQSRSATFSSTP